jgi:membrane-bound inhibitor of C-type lysozyme
MSKKQANKLIAIRKAMDSALVTVVEKGTTEAINAVTSIMRKWTPAVYVIGDVRTENNVPYKCVQAHDSTTNPTWTPSATSSLWMQYHGTSIDTARNWIAPTGAHDMYKVGEYMIWTDGKIYKCIQDTTYDPVAYAQAWEVQE